MKVESCLELVIRHQITQLIWYWYFLQIWNSESSLILNVCLIKYTNNACFVWVDLVLYNANWI